MMVVSHVWLRRLLFFSLVASTTLLGAGLMVGIVRDEGVTMIEVVILALFVPTFAWISMAFWNGAIGFILMMLARHPLTLAPEEGDGAPPPPIGSRVALVMPVHREDPGRVTGALAAMVDSLASTDRPDLFDLHLLSDTVDATLARREEAAWASVRQRLRDSPVGLHYRRRRVNVGRKAGNIADFCRQSGSRYDFMIVLDADSLMSGAALVRLVLAMEANPQAGLIQTVPIPVRQATPFGRLLQFAAGLYSPVLATGQSFWHGGTANYWGHNAIVRSAAFPAYCELPVLSGRPPLGGAILSHDFVEAAMVRRAGWQVYLLPAIDGSYEELPGTLPDYARRDRRWCQGSLQHLRLLTTRGLHPLNRLHFVLGAMSYISSVLWLLLLLTSTAYILLPRLSTDPFMADAIRPGAPGIALVPLLAVTAGLLFVPKLFGLLLALARDRGAFGGPGRLLIGALLETAFAVLIAPLMMMIHTRCVWSVLTGHDVKWEAQRRDGCSVSWGEAWRETAGISVVGAAWAGLTLYASPPFFVWLTPIFAGLLLAAPIVRWSSNRSLGRWFRRVGLFAVPSETAPPSVLQVAGLEDDDPPTPPGEGALDVGFTPAAP